MLPYAEAQVIADNFVNGNLIETRLALGGYNGIDACVMTLLVLSNLPPKLKLDFEQWMLKFSY